MYYILYYKHNDFCNNLYENSHEMNIYKKIVCFDYI